MLNKFIIAMLACTMLLPLSGCGRNSGNIEPANPPAAEEQSNVSDGAVSQDIFETPVEKSKLLGMWYNEENSASIQFNEDGTFINDSIEGTYKTEANKVFLTYYGGEVTDEYNMGFMGDKLVLTADDFQMIFDKK